MALRDYLSAKTYTAISNLIYEKNLKRCTAMLEIWTDDSKTLLLANKGVTIDGTIKIPPVASLEILAQSEPEDKNPDMYYIIAQDAKGSFAGYEGQLTRFNPHTNNWDKWVLWEGLMVFVEDESKYYQRVDGNWKENLDCSSDARIWDKWMAPEIAMAKGTNPMQQMYKFMKTLPQFKNCKDA
jgi:hypothetical protein